MAYSDQVQWLTATERLRAEMEALPRGDKKELAEKLGVSPAQLSQFISGERGITPARAHEIAAALGWELNVQLKRPGGIVEE